MSEQDPLATVTRDASRAPSPGGWHARLRAVHPANLRWTLRLDQSEAIIGRSPSVEVESGLTHGTVSRRHFAVRWDARRDQHVGRDLGSHNGSRVEGRDIGTSTVALVDNGVLQLGDVCVVYERFAAGIQPPDETTDVDEIIPGRAPAMVALRGMIARAAPDPSPVLLLGETGTGKEHIARELHRRSGRSGPLVSINCSALNPQIIDSQLFGHVKGAFTGATTDQPGLFRAAGGGTLFLDEIGDLPLSLQPKLLRALQEGEVQPIGSAKLVPVDVRVIAATHADLVRRVDADAFRRDLYARLAMWELSVPPLRQRRGDVLDWLERMHTAWLDKRPEQPGDPLTLSPEAAETLLLYDWPSNLRELDRLVHELASHPSLARPIARQMLPDWLDGELPTAANPRQTVPSAPVTAKPPVPSREQFVAAFEQLEGNVRALAKHFARDRRQIYRWIEAHDLLERRNKS